MAEEAYVPGLVRWLAVVVVAVTVLVAAVVRPGQGVGQTGPLGLLTFDLWLHAGAYLLLELLVVYALVGGGSRPTVPVSLTATFVFAYSCLVEGVQLYIDYRTFSEMDLLANAVGIGAGLCLYGVGRWLLAREPGV